MVVFDLAFISMGAIPRATQLRTSVPNAAQHDLESYSGPGGSEVQILSPRPFVSKTCIQFLVFRCAVKRARIDGVTRLHQVVNSPSSLLAMEGRAWPLARANVRIS